MNKKKILKTIMSLLIVITLTPQVAFAHKGRTDSSGGHRDNKNVSGLGYYHYHCGGHPAHLHANGVCPYGNNSSSSSTSSNDNDVSKRNEAQKNGYDAVWGSSVTRNSVFSFSTYNRRIPPKYI